ncbi:GD25899 [Drosophila simulans]|uniref:GD25899 n=1 Tax=Drosophila simulans TaxID=7240 RepID=B4QBM0_DROSI|nr:GD25899 [Drosophila simulans]
MQMRINAEFGGAMRTMRSIERAIKKPQKHICHIHGSINAAQDAGVKSSAPFDLETTDTCLHPHSSTSLIARAAGIANCAFWVPGRHPKKPKRSRAKKRGKPSESAESSIRQTKNTTTKRRGKREENRAKLQPEHWRNKTNEKRGKAERSGWLGGKQPCQFVDARPSDCLTKIITSTMLNAVLLCCNLAPHQEEEDLRDDDVLRTPRSSFVMMIMSMITGLGEESTQQTSRKTTVDVAAFRCPEQLVAQPRSSCVVPVFQIFQNSLMRSAINAHSPLGRITHLEKEPSLSPDRMCAVLPAKWIKISVVLRSVICI